MSQRISNYHTLATASFKAMLALEQSFADSSIEPAVRELVKLRASQINGCAYCLHMHATDARRMGEDEMRIHMLPAWRESSLYSARERAALGWTEAWTHVSETGAPDADFAAVKAQFTEVEQVQLTWMIASINGWNRVAIGLRAEHPAKALGAKHRDAA